MLATACHRLIHRSHAQVEQVFNRVNAMVGLVPTEGSPTSRPLSPSASSYPDSFSNSFAKSTTAPAAALHMPGFGQPPAHSDDGPFGFHDTNGLYLGPASGTATPPLPSMHAQPQHQHGATYPGGPPLSHASSGGSPDVSPPQTYPSAAPPLYNPSFQQPAASWSVAPPTLPPTLPPALPPAVPETMYSEPASFVPPPSAPTARTMPTRGRPASMFAETSMPSLYRDASPANDSVVSCPIFFLSSSCRV